MKLRNYLVAFFISMLVVSVFNTELKAQIKAPLKLGIYGGYGYNFHIPYFKNLPNVYNCCPLFTDGGGFGVNYGAFLEYMFAERWALSLDFKYSELYGQLSYREYTKVNIDGRVSDGAFDHKINFFADGFSITPKIKFNVVNNLFVDYGWQMTSLKKSRFEQYEVIAEPAGRATFIDERGNDTKSMTRNQMKGDLTGTADIMHSFNFGIGYYLPLNKKGNLFLYPHIGYSIGVNDIINNYSWKINNLSASLGIVIAPQLSGNKDTRENYVYIVDTVYIENCDNYRFLQGKEKTELKKVETDDEIITMTTTSRTDTICKAKIEKIGKIEIEVSGIDENGNIIKNPKFVSEEFIENRNQPILNYIFFDENSYQLPEKYKQLSIKQAEDFKIESLYRCKTLETYYQILNIVGYRLKNNPNANIKIVGCNGDIFTELNNITLSRNRANTVYNYLTAIWGIDPSRIKVSFQNLPTNFSYPNNQKEKQQENRRVEIIADDYSIFEPIYIEDVKTVNTPAVARFEITSEDKANIAEWKLAIVNQTEAGNSEIIKTGKGNLPNILNVKLDEVTKNKGFEDSKLRYYVAASDANGKVVRTDEKDFSIDKWTVQRKKVEKRGDFEIEKFSLILFDFVSDQLSEDNRKTLELARSKIRPNSIVKIYGYTDITGDAEYNRKLSKRRAEAVYQKLNVKNAIVDGFGESVLLYDNEIPEGRFYCRTVEIIVETPINYEQDK